MKQHLFITALALAAAPLCASPANAGPASVELKGHAVQQVALTTSDLPRAIRFYRDTLGLPYLFETNGMAFFDVAGMRLMIALDQQRPASKRPTSILYFDAPDFTQTLARLKATSVQLEGPVETLQRTPEGDLMLQQFNDPDGNALAIMGTVRAR